MNDKMEILLNKINMDKKNYPYFSNAKLTKIRIHKQIGSWEVFITNTIPVPLEVLKELEEKKANLDEHAKEITFIWDIENIDINIYLSYYPYVLEQLKDELKVLEIYNDALKIEDGFLVLVASSEVE